MFVEMSCSCGASFQTDAQDNDSIAMLWATQFSNAHVGCGFMSKPTTLDSKEKTKRYDITRKTPREKEL